MLLHNILNNFYYFEALSWSKIMYWFPNEPPAVIRDTLYASIVDIPWKVDSLIQNVDILEWSVIIRLIDGLNKTRYC